jgi:cation diffusion facilitator CzcD-associated flavoprotein CzcO
VGAGLAGLNAIFDASRYLSRDEKVILIDRRQRVGGMCVDTHPYVRLHQPHGMFTAGNIEWTLGKDRSYLARTARCSTTLRVAKLLVVETRRLIKAAGFRVMPNDPLEFSSARVQSVFPDSCDMRCGEIRAGDAPVWIVGAGKTAMDTAHALITACPGAEVNLIAGSGTAAAPSTPCANDPTSVAAR